MIDNDQPVVVKSSEAWFSRRVEGKYPVVTSEERGCLKLSNLTFAFSCVVTGVDSLRVSSKV
jgi:hypothetical protein